MTAEYPTLAQLLSKHCCCGFNGSYRDWPEYAQTQWLKTRLITSIQQLDELPPGSVVMTVSRNQMTVWVRCGDEEKGVKPGRPVSSRTLWGSERGQWWMHGHDDAFPSRDLLYGEPELVILLWHPDEFKSLGLETPDD